MSTVLVVKERSSAMWTPRNLMLCALCTTTTSIMRGLRAGLLFFLKSITISFVLLTLSSKAVRPAPSCQPLHLHSVCSFVLVLDESHHRCVVSILNDLIGRMWGSVVVGEKTEQEGNQNATLGGAEFTVMQLDVLLPIYTACCCCVWKLRIQSQMLVPMFSDLSFSTSCCGMIALKAELKSMNRTLA